ncbi:hypothetical protein MTO96_052123 [Rhipicephalus appendiculatus]
MTPPRRVGIADDVPQHSGARDALRTPVRRCASKGAPRAFDRLHRRWCRLLCHGSCDDWPSAWASPNKNWQNSWPTASRHCQLPNLRPLPPRLLPSHRKATTLPGLPAKLQLYARSPFSNTR